MRLRRRQDGTYRASKVDVGFCRSRYCANCLPNEAQEDMAELWLAGAHVLHSGGALLHLIATAAHDRTDSYAEAAARVQAGWEAVCRSTLWKDVYAYGVVIALRLAAAREARGSDGLFLRKPERDALVRSLKAEGEAAERGLWAWAAGREETWALRNGHHPHLHSLLFLREDLDPLTVLAFRQRVLAEYRAGLAKVGGTCDDTHGVRIEVATIRRDGESVLARYITKICLEITRGDRKVPKQVVRWTKQRDGEMRATVEDRFTPWDWLRAIEADTEFSRSGDLDVAQKATRRYIRLWREWEEATAGKPRLTHSPRRWAALLAEAQDCDHAECVKARDATAEEETTTPPIPGEPEVTEDTPDTIDWPKDAHRLVMNLWDETDVVDRVERDGWAPMLNELTRRGVAWRWRRDDPWWDADEGEPACWTWATGEMTRTEHHVSGACMCWQWSTPLPRGQLSLVGAGELQTVAGAGGDDAPF